MVLPKTRLLYIHQYFRLPSDAGGTRSWEVSRRLRDDYDVHVLTSSHHGGPDPWLVETTHGLTVHRFDLPYPHDHGDSERMSAFLRFAVEAARYGWRLDPDVVLATSTPLTIAIPAIALRWGRRIPMSFEVRDLWPDAPIALGALRNRPLILAAKALERLAYRSANQVIALSPPQAEAVRRRGGGDVLVVPNFSNTNLFDQATNEPADLPTAIGDRPIVLYAGARGLVNGAEWLVDVAAACPDDDIVFLMVGAGREDDAIRTRARQLGVLDRTVFVLPERPKETMPALMRRTSLACDLIIDEPELWKASPNKVFDAFASGTPLLLNHGGWIADLVTDTGAGIVAHGMTPTETADAIAEFVRSSDAIEQASKASRNLAREFDVERGCAAIIDAIGATLDGGTAATTAPGSNR